MCCSFLPLLPSILTAISFLHSRKKMDLLAWCHTWHSYLILINVFNFYKWVARQKKERKKKNAVAFTEARTSIHSYLQVPFKRIAKAKSWKGRKRVLQNENGGVRQKAETGWSQHMDGKWKSKNYLLKAKEKVMRKWNKREPQHLIGEKVLQCGREKIKGLV